MLTDNFIDRVFLQWNVFQEIILKMNFLAIGFGSKYVLNERYPLQMARIRNSGIRRRIRATSL